MWSSLCWRSTIGFKSTSTPKVPGLNVLANDIRNAQYIGAPYFPELTIQDAALDGEGTLTFSADRSELIYTPAPGFEGVQSIAYVAIDSDGYTVDGTAKVRVSSEHREALWPEQLQQQLVQRAVDQNQYRFGAPFAAQYDERIYFGPDVPVASDSGSPDVSGTNNQIAEVDESDRIKTDGQFLYALSSPDRNDWYGWDIFPWIGMPRAFAPIPESGQGNMLTVIDVRQPSSPLIVSRQLFDDRVLSLDLHGDRLTLISQRGQQTVLTALDVADPKHLQTVWTTVVDGSFKQARRVNDTLYVFTTDHGSRVPPLESICTADEEFCFFETGEQYLQRVTDEVLLQSLLPSQQVFDAAGNQVDDLPAILVDPLVVGLPEYYGRLNIIAFDTATAVGGAIDWDLSDAAEHVLVTTESIFTTRTNYQSDHFFEDDVAVFTGIPERPTVTTEITRFALQTDGSVQPAAAGVVPGTLKNSFSLDEQDGLLRIATENSWWGATAEVAGSNIYVLQPTGGTMHVIGGVQGLAPGEQIYAVRFAGDRGYVVTFRRVDPLFVVDLSEPTAPAVLGQLKAPGYSQYLQIIDQNHLLGIGRDADEQTGLYGGLVVSLFNVSDPTDPRVQDRYEFAGGRSTFSPFAEDSPWDLRDHHAISYFPSSGILALPIYSRQSGVGEGQDRPIFDSPNQSAVRTLQIDTAAGISELDSIPFDSRADRALRIGEHLYSLSNQELKVTRLLQPGQIVAALQFERQGQDDFVDTIVGDPVTIDVTENDLIGDDHVEVLAATLLDGEGSVEIVDGKQIRFTPHNRKLTEQHIRYTARNAAGTLIDAIATVDPDLQWQNERSSLDVNDDQKTTARDALNIINWLKIYGAVDSEVIEQAIGDADNMTDRFYFDTTGDQRLSARDALLVINALIEKTILAATPNKAMTPEAESIPTADTPPIGDHNHPVASFDTPVQFTPESIDIVLTKQASDDEDREAALALF